MCADHARVVATGADLAVIHDPEVNLAIWPRDLPSDLRAQLDTVATSDLPDLRLTLPASAASAAVTQALASLTTDWTALAADLRQVLALYLAIVPTPTIEVRIERVTTDLCQRWHTDNVGIRLLTTYRGPGTHWADNAWVRRDALGPSGLDNDAIVPPQAPRQVLARGAIALLKGCAQGATGIVHRSPPLDGSGLSRLLVVIEPAH